MLLCGACSAGSGWKKSAELVRDDGVLVQREQRADYLAEHPAELNAELLADELCALRYVDRYVVGAKMDPAPAWPCESARAVARGIAQGLAQAAPNERVRFWVRWGERDPSAAWYLPQERHTRGVAYWRAGGLELAFDRVDVLEGDTPPAAKDPTQHATRRIRLVPPPGAINVEVEGKRRPMQLRWERLGAGPDDEPEASLPPADPLGLSPEQRARLELLEDLHEAGEIDTASFEKRREELFRDAEK